MTDAWERDFGTLELVQDRKPGPMRQPAPRVQNIPGLVAPRDQRLGDRIERRVEAEADRQAPGSSTYVPPPGFTVRTVPEVGIPGVYDGEGEFVGFHDKLPVDEQGIETILRKYPSEINSSHQYNSLKGLNRVRAAQGKPPVGPEYFQQPGAPAQPEAAPAPPQPQQTPSGDAWARDFGSVQPQAPAPAAPKPRDPNAEPDSASWLGRRIQDVRGKRDPRYKDLPNIANVLMDEGGHQILPEIWSWGVGASDKDMGKVYEPMLADRFIRHEQDANGYPIIVYRGKDGAEQRAYVNSPGIDMQDVARGAFGAVPYVAGGLAAGSVLKGAPLLGRVGGQGLAQAGVSAAQDVAGSATGVTDLDLERSAIKAGVSAGFGAAGEAGGAFVNYLMRTRAEGQLFKNGVLTPEGVQVAQQAGIDPAMLTGKTAQDFAKAFARSGDANGAFIEATSKEFKIPRTMGELTQNKNQLLREQQMRGGTYGETARVRIAGEKTGFDARQAKAIENAVRGEIEPGRPGIMGQVAPTRDAAGMTKADIGGNIKANTQAAYDAAKEIENEAWKKVSRVDATPEALAELDSFIQPAVKNFRVHSTTTPKSVEMAKALDEFKAGKIPAKEADILPSGSVGDINTMREHLLDLYGMAYRADPGGRDQKIAKAMYDAFNDWIVVAAEKAGDPATAIAMRTARGISRDVHAAFEAGGNDAGSRIMANILKGKTDNPEGIISELLSTPGKAEIKNGATSAIKSLFGAYDKYLSPEAAELAKGDIRLAFLDRMMQTKAGEVMTPGVLQKALKTARSNQASLYNYLFSPEQRATLARLEQAMVGIEKKNPNTSWSGISVGALMKDLGTAIFKAFGGQSATAKIIGSGLYNRAEKSVGGYLANKATGGGAGAQVPSLPAPSWGGYGGAYGGSRTDSR